MDEGTPGISYFIAPDGDDHGPGTRDQPFATLDAGSSAARERKTAATQPVTVVLDGGTYYVSETFVLGPQDSGTSDAPVTYAARDGDHVTVSGARKLTCTWEPYRDGIMVCSLPPSTTEHLQFSQLFVNGKRQIRARYPNYDGSESEAIQRLYHRGGRAR